MDLRKISFQIIFLAIAGAVMAGAIAYNAKVNDAYSDSRLYLLVSQAMLEEHTVRLDSYVPLYEPLYMNKHHGIYRRGGHTYDLFPLGTPVFSLPAVYLYLKAGLVMYDDRDIATVQATLKSVVVPMVFVALFWTGLMYVTPLESFIITVISFLGSSLMSTMGSALWSHDFGVLFASLAILVLVRHDTRRAILNPYLLGVLLFCAYLSRPTFSLFILATFVYLFLEDRKLLIKTALTAFVFFLGLVVFALNEYGMILPPYYRGNIYTYTGNWFETVYGMLLSPSRGLLVYSPFLIAVIAAAIMSGTRVLKGRLALLMALWFLAQFLVLSSFEDIWWGGGDFGLRQMVDTSPAVALISFMLYRWVSGADLRRAALHALVWAYIVLGAVSIWINTKQGLYNIWTARWNHNPKTTKQAVFDWRYPQFLMDEDRTRKRVLAFLGRDEKEYTVFVDEKTSTLNVVPIVPPKQGR